MQKVQDKTTAADEPRIITPTSADVEAAVAALRQDAAPAAAPEVAEPSTELTEAEQQAQEYLEHLQRLRAEFDNYRRRTARERDEYARYATITLLTDLLDVLDSFDRAQEALAQHHVDPAMQEGVAIVSRQLWAALEKRGLERLEALGRPFDPTVHEAALHEPSETYASGVVSGVITPGYRLGDRVLRPALVRVSKGNDVAGDGQAESAV